MAEHQFYVILNARAGTASALGLDGGTLLDHFTRRGKRALVDDDVDLPLAERIERAMQSEADVIVAGGGDGTVSAVAEAVMGTEKTLAILPLGTANLLARDLTIPLDIEDWFNHLDDMHERHIDVGTVNGRLFMHMVVVGLLPGLAAGREKVRGHRNPFAALRFLHYAARRIVRARRIAVKITPKIGTPHVERLQAIGVANNAYDEGLGRFFSRSRLDTGTLSLYMLKRLNIGDFLRLTFEMLTGNWRKDEVVAYESVQAVTINSRRNRLKTMLDGEVVAMDTPMRFEIHPGALKVLAPAVPAEKPLTAGNDPNRELPGEPALAG